jgi:hypothetical protein
MIGPSSDLVRFLVQAPPGDAWVDVIELSHAAWPQPYVLISYNYTARVRFEDGRIYDALPLAFRVDLPDAGTQGRQDMGITLDNVGAEIWYALELAQTKPEFPITVTWRVYLKSDFTAPAAQPFRLSVVNVTATEQAVQMTAQRSDIINRRWPRTVYKPERWPGLIR